MKKLTELKGICNHSKGKLKYSIFLMIIATIFIANYSIAQDNKTDFRDMLQFGLKIGANFSNVYDTKGEDFNADPKMGLAIGTFVAIPIGTYIGVQPEILFSQKGFRRATGSLLGSTYEFTRTTNYIDVPLLATLKPSEFVTLLAGPQLSFLIKQKDVFANETTSIQQEQVFENDNLRKSTLCFIAGFDINIKHIILSARIGWDFLNNNGDGTSSTPRAIKMSGIRQLSGTDFIWIKNTYKKLTGNSY